ncbi:hypothetical protein FK220_007930 [Flavobacteriaceae bacterium TP-CH-4]|uniref:Uncharacterized protein n=1 Tax=Pelagihabitans pacificus TaxID=2696054 RepID=A0A967E652_9FLAO|nr:hypothetical protein [Pelagihabitans pacificus]NHF59265.1 hypothetical protein [Pelagihabitans pacificus]
MRTYNLFNLLLACLVLMSCSTSDEGTGVGEGPTNPGTDADYVLLLTSGTTLKSQLLNAGAELVTVNPADSDFKNTGIPDLTYREGLEMSFYQRTGVCGGEILKYDFINDTATELALFEDLGDCGLTAYAIAHTETRVYVAYGLEVDAKDTKYFVRVVDLDSTDENFVDVPLDKKPLDLVFTNNRLFVLALDEAVTDENALFVMDAATNTMIIEMNLGFDAQRLIKNSDGNLVISYDELHTLLNSQTLSIQYVNYQEGKEPRFVSSRSNNFDNEGRLYYEMSPGENSSYPKVPGIYDFANDIVILYAYENFLTEAQRTIEYEIETTTMVDFDTKNGYMLIGYKKVGLDKGGLLRVKTGSEPAVIDNLDVDGIPYAIIVK